jgi:hypothetical protein
MKWCSGPTANRDESAAICEVSPRFSFDIEYHRLIDDLKLRERAQPCPMVWQVTRLETDMKTYLTIAACALVLGLPSLGAAKAELKTQVSVQEMLITAALAYEIGKVCEDVDVRLIRGISYLNSIKSHAKSLGYSSDEIDSYMDDKPEQKRLTAIAYERLWALGATKGNAESHCVVGKSEMEKQSQIGLLLK